MLKGFGWSPVLLILSLWTVFFLSRCATTGSSMQQNETQVEDVADIDELLGLTEEKTSKPQRDDSIEEDDVLRLLGVVEEGGGTTPSKTGSSSKTNLEQEVQRLEYEQSQLDRQEKGLQQTVTQQTETIAAAKTGTGGVDAKKTSANWKTSTYTDRYQEALKEYGARRYSNAIQKFEDLLSSNNRHSLSDNCQYWIGEAYFGLGSYQQAIMAFEKVFAFTNTNKNDDAQLKLGLCYIKLEDKERAKNAFQKLVDNYPTSEFVSLAKRFISQKEE